MKKLSSVTFLAAIAVALLAGCGESDKEKSKKTLVLICAESSERLAAGAADDFELVLENALRSCSGACDLGDGTSCSSLEGHLGKVCGVSPTVCEKLCESSSPSLKKHACAIAKTATK